MPRKDVIIECRIPRGRITTAAAIKILGDAFASSIDRCYPPVMIRAADQRLQLSIDASAETIVLLRGEVYPDELEDLNSQTNVIGVYADTTITPFSKAHQRHKNDWIVETKFPSPNQCPIPPCDCQPNQPHGTIGDVATYLGLEQIWRDGIKGEGMVIGVLDAGICAESRLTSAAGLVPNVLGGWPDANWGTLAGWGHHGNMIGTDLLGIAPHASLFDIRITNDNAMRSCLSNAIAGVDWAIKKYRFTKTPQVLCCGWGVSQEKNAVDYANDPTHPLSRKISEALDEGMLVIFAAGNSGKSCPAIESGSDIGPGRSIWGVNGHSRVITVGAVNIEEQLIGYSSQGPAALDSYKPDICGISHFSGYFDCDSGTSTACAVTSGVVALLKQACPTLTQESVKRLLKETAKEIGPPGWDRHSGSGIIQAKTAYNRLVEQHSLKTVGDYRIERIEEENRNLKDLYVDLVLERKKQNDSEPPTHRS